MKKSSTPVSPVMRKLSTYIAQAPRWPVGCPIQAPLDALSNVMAARGVTAKDVERVLITLDEHGARADHGRHQHPASHGADAARWRHYFRVVSRSETRARSGST